MRPATAAKGLPPAQSSCRDGAHGAFQLRLLISLSGFAAALHILTSGDESLLAVLPGAYATLLLLSPAMIKYRPNNIGITTLNVVIIVRYLIAPVVWSSHGLASVRGVVPSTDSYKWAVLLMVIELIAVFAVVAALGPKYLERGATGKSIAITSESTLRLSAPLLAITALGPVLIGTNPAVSARYNFAFDAEALAASDLPDAPHAVLILSDISLALIPLLLVSMIKRRYDASGGLVWVLLALAACLPFMLIFKESSRFSVLIPTVALLVILVRTFPRHRLLTKTVVLLVLTSVVTAISLVKNFGSPGGTGGSREGVNTGHFSDLLDAYLSGPQNMGRAIDLWLSDSVPPGSAINDLFGNIAGLSRLSDRDGTTTVLFNQYFYGAYRSFDQIIPLSGQSLIHFGVLGAPILMMLAVGLLVRMDSILANEHRLELVYGYVYVTVYLGCAMMLSFGSVFSSFTNILLPLVLVLVCCQPFRYLPGSGAARLSNKEEKRAAASRPPKVRSRL